MTDFLHPAAPKPSRTVHWSIAGLAIGAAIFLLACVAAWGYSVFHAGRFWPGVSILSVRLDNLSAAEAEARLRQTITTATAHPLSFRFDDRTFLIPLRSKGVDLVSYDLETAMAQAKRYNPEQLSLANLFLPLTLRLRSKEIFPPVRVDEVAITRLLEEQLAPLLVTPKDAELKIQSTNKGTLTLTIEPERLGRTLDLRPTLAELQTQARTLAFAPLALHLNTETPRWSARDLEPLKADVPAWIKHAPFTLTSEGQRWSIDKSTLAAWISVTSSNDGSPMLALDSNRVGADLNYLGRDLLKEPHDGKLEFENDKVKIFQAPEEGIEINTEQAIQTILLGFEHGSSTIPLVLTHVTPILRGEAAERLGIKEMLGVGRSNFSGSPVNRRKNIALGATKVNFSLIPPGEEFSLLKALGKIDAPEGWLPELVIKGNKTTPEFGGGLCQIGTTTFRAALASGLPITERRNHSYRVRYYEPAGTDATIYDPAPDMKFKNDTPGSILITTRVRGDNLSFTFWGTADGRTAAQTTPTIANIVQPPPKKEVETLDLPPGKTKCTETAHAGADARFDYRVTYQDGEVKKTSFYSHYKPWQAVCLLGVSHLSATSTPAVDQTGLNNPTL